MTPIDGPSRRERLARLIKPRSVVFVGGAATEPSIAYARQLGFEGTIQVINPRREEIAGIPCHRSAKDLPHPPDAAFVAVPKDGVIEAVRDLAEAGIGAAVVNTAGFAEIGRGDLQEALLEAAGDMPIMGPNCAGFTNFLDRAAVILDNLGLEKTDRGVAVISNGGAYIADITCSDRSIPVAYIMGLGNQAAISVADMVDVILDDERVTAINLYFEGIRDVARLSETALKARRKGVPIVAIKAGKTKAGNRATASHTASIASDSVVTSALFRRLGMIEVKTASEATETLKMLTFTGRPNGRRVGFATSSGTYAVLGADATEEAGLDLPLLTTEQKTTLQPLLEQFIEPNNPIDLATAQFWPDADQQKLFDAFLSCGFDIALQCMSFPAPGTWEDESWYRSSRIFAQAAQKVGLPVAFVAPTPEGLPKKAREMLIQLGVAPLQGLRDGLSAIAHAVAYWDDQNQFSADRLLPTPADPPCDAVNLNEYEAKQLLAKAGLPVPKGFLWDGNSPLPAVAYPVALKICDASLLHKSDIGGVAINIPNETALAGAAKRMSSQRDRQFLVEEMIDGAVAELLVGIRHIHGMGQALTLASGGTAAELLQDAATLLLPVQRNDIEAALRSLRLFPLLEGWRGGPKADMNAALDVIEKLCDLASSHRDKMSELEINPLILREEGRGVAAADALLKLTEKDPS